MTRTQKDLLEGHSPCKILFQLCNMSVKFLYYRLEFELHYLVMWLTISAFSIMIPVSDTAKPLSKFIKITTMKKTKITRNEKENQEIVDSGSMGISENSNSPTNIVIVFTILVHGPSK